MANSDITSQLQNFLDNNTPGGYFQTETNISSDDLQNRINAVINEKGYLTNESIINYPQIQTALNNNLKKVSFSGRYRDLDPIFRPKFPEGYSDWLLENSTEEPPTFHKVAFSGKYNDLIGIPSLDNLHVSWDNVDGKNSALATVALTGKYTDLDFDGAEIELPNLATVATSGKFSDLVDKESAINSIITSVNNASQNSLDVIYIHNIVGETCPLSNLMDGEYEVDNAIAEDSTYSIRDLLNDMINEFQTELIFKETLVKLITNWGTCILLGIEEKNDIIKFTFSFIDKFTDQNLDYLKNHRGETSPQQVQDKLNHIRGNYFYPAFYFDKITNKLLVRRNFTLLSLDVKQVAITGDYNDLNNRPTFNAIKTFNIPSNSLDEHLRFLTEGKINTTNNLTNNSGQGTINTWLMEIINTYNLNQETKIIQIKNEITDLVLENIKNNNNVYIFSFSPIVSSNYDTIQDDDDSNILSNLIITSYRVYFIYDTNKNLLWIKRKEI